MSIDPDTAVPETKAVREQKAVQIFQLLGQRADVDQISLLKTLIGNFGVEYEGLIPENPGGTGEPVSFENFKNMQGQGSTGPGQTNELQQALAN